MKQSLIAALDGEREYQLLRWGHLQEDGSLLEPPHSPDEFLLYMQHYLTKAIAAASTQDGPQGALAEMRKVVALGIACFEQHECPDRLSIDLNCRKAVDGKWSTVEVLNGRDGTWRTMRCGATLQK